MENEKSELELLLEKNTSTTGLTVDEIRRAEELIANPKFSGGACWLCKAEAAIYDTGLCTGHAAYALIRRK